MRNWLPLQRGARDCPAPGSSSAPTTCRAAWPPPGRASRSRPWRAPPESRGPRPRESRTPRPRRNGAPRRPRCASSPTAWPCAESRPCGPGRAPPGTPPRPSRRRRAQRDSWGCPARRHAFKRVLLHRQRALVLGLGLPRTAASTSYMADMPMARAHAGARRRHAGGGDFRARLLAQAHMGTGTSSRWGWDLRSAWVRRSASPSAPPAPWRPQRSVGRPGRRDQGVRP